MSKLSSDSLYVMMILFVILFNFEHKFSTFSILFNSSILFLSKTKELNHYCFEYGWINGEAFGQNQDIEIVK